MFDTDDLDALYAEASRADGIALETLNLRIADFAEADRSAEDVQLYRERSGPWKRLREEIVPVARLLTRLGRSGRLRFPLDDGPIDALFRADGGEDWSRIEVTGALTRSQIELARQLREGPAAGFRALSDDRSQAEFDAARKRSRLMHAPKELFGAIESAVATALKKKNKEKYAGATLLINGPIGSVPAHHRPHVVETLRKTVPDDHPFAEIFVMDAGERAEPVRLYP